jgi:Tfp pilus assembly protein PilF
MMAKLNERRGNITQAQNFYKQYVDAGPNNPSNLIEAQYSIAQINLKKGKRSEFEAGCSKVIAMQRRLSSSKAPVGVREAAECKYIQVSKIYDELRAVRIPANPKAQQAAVQNKLALLNRLKDQLKSVILYDDGPMVVNSLALIGQAYQHMAAAIYAVPLPKGLDEEGLKQYKAGVDGVAKPFQDEAIKNYEAAIDKGYKLEGYGEGLKTAQRELNRLNKDKALDFGERAVITKITDYMGVKDQDDLKEPFESKEERLMVEAVSKRLGKDQNDLIALNALAVFYYEQGKYGLSKILLGRALNAHPNEPGLHNNQGVIALAENKQRQAIGSFRKAMDIKSGYTVGAANLGSVFVEYRDYSRAADMLDSAYSAIRSDLRRGGKVSLEIANNYALALMGTGDNDKARDIFENILKADNGNSTALLNYAILLIHKIKDKKEGEKQLNRLRFIGEDGDNRMKKAIEEMDKALGQND